MFRLIFEILDRQRGIPSKCKSAACVYYVPALCTHRPSLLPIEWFSEILGLELSCSAMNEMDSGKLLKPDHLEEVKVVPDDAGKPSRGVGCQCESKALKKL